MVKDVEDRDSVRDSRVSDLDLRRARGGKVISARPSRGSSLKTGRDGSSLPGVYMLSSSGWKLPGLSTASSTFRKFEGLLMLGLCDVLRLVNTVVVLDTLEAILRPSTSH